MASFNSPTPHLFVHRGGNAAGTDRENTLSAFQSAVNLGYEFLETDVVVTRDNQVINYHGSANLFMKIIFGLEVRSKVQKLTYDQVKRNINPDGKNIPKFEDLLLSFKNKCFCVDVKTDEAVEPLVDIIKRNNAEDRVIITSFSKKRSLRANTLIYGQAKNACLCVYRMKGLLISLFPKLLLSRLKKQGFSYIHVPYRCITKKLVTEAKQQKVKIYAWTVNEGEKIKELLEAGIDGIISDEAEILLNSHKKH